MIHNTPSFLRLFSRGRYRSIIPEDDTSAEAKAEREERERFAVTALGFCLKQDPHFLQHFWKQVCRVPGDRASMPPIKTEDILLEPPHWADLQLVSKHKNKRFVWVIEVKAGAPLDPKQRPDRRLFQKRGIGYGALFAQAESNLGTHMRYIVLGSNETDNLKISRGEVCLGIHVQKRHWHDLASCLARKGIVKDLCDTLAEFKINPFYMEKAKLITVRDQLSSVGKAWTVLDSVCETMSIKHSCRDFAADTHENDTESGSVGTCIKPTKRQTSSQSHVRLQRLTREKGWCLAWFGYEYEGPNAVRKSVYFFFNTVQKQKAFQKLFPHAKAFFDRREYYSIVKQAPIKCNNDFDWFTSIFRHALGK